MRKTMLAAAALLALGSVNEANAFSLCPGSNSVGAVAAPATGAAVGVGTSLMDANSLAIGANGAASVGAGFLVGYPLLIGGIVVCDILDGGLNRKLAEVTPGAGYQPGNLASRDDESTRLIAAYRRYEETENLASATR